MKREKRRGEGQQVKKIKAAAGDALSLIHI